MNATMKCILSGAAVLLLNVPTFVHAQTVAFNGAGSSAIFLELGEAAAAQLRNGATQCLWTSKSNGTAGAYVTDTSSGSSLVDAGQAWVAWTPGTDSTSNASCTTDATNNFSNATVYAYIQEDSVVGNRALFNGDVATYPGTLATANLIGSVNSSITETINLPSAIATALGTSSNNKINAAGTDIRPEDAQFAINRARTPSGSSVSGSNSLGLGYQPVVQLAIFQAGWQRSLMERFRPR